MLKFIIISIALFSPLVLVSQPSANPPAQGFNLEGSDPRAIQIADEVMQALGGRQNWDDTRCLTWKFFGRRRHVWDKWSGDLRFEDSDLIVLMNLNSGDGRAWKSGEEIQNPDSLKELLDHAYAAWINDSYWMFMPYKLKDNGVTLKYKGEGETTDGKPADVLQLTFNGVGLTPQNKYLVYVDKESRLVTQWDYFRNADDEEPTLSTPWRNWKRYGEILLSDDRGERKMTDVAVLDEAPPTVFETPQPIDFDRLIE